MGYASVSGVVSLDGSGSETVESEEVSAVSSFSFVSVVVVVSSDATTYSSDVVSSGEGTVSS